MAIEIERKFLVDAEKWRLVDKVDSTFYRQGYLVLDQTKTIRIRVSDKNGFITIKGSGQLSRKEFEYEIPLKDATEMIENFAVGTVEKTRFRIPFAGKVWEVDEFSGDNEGLIIAELELEREDESIEYPDWVKEEVTDQSRYYNSCLSTQPYKNW